ncbi:hypothetical protein LM602_02280 [Candidatus Acetothermia bacterium]|jgi:hypothetical protein|nr:hypothetical protein [Candidatus Acetothermia bacterium]MCI2431372.1 hypothetical protein [Candidatus Acetothermia bacterium]MCI2435820.1 hypothetical protein [Candidatus Acetothermia bacterium]
MKRELTLVLVSATVMLLLVVGVQVLWQTAQSQPNIPNELIVRPFAEIRFEAPADWKSEPRGNCIAYIPKGGRVARATVTRPDGTRVDHQVASTGSVVVCVNIVHVDTVGRGF